MPTNLSTSAVGTTYRPGVYAEVKVNELGGRGLSVNNLAVIGAFPALASATPKKFSSAATIMDLDPSDLNLFFNF